MSICTVSLDARLLDTDADAVFDRIGDFPRYADHTDAVREVRVHEPNGQDVTSVWSVNFRDGVMEWTERDRIDPEARHIAFELIDGDFALFTGAWSVAQTGNDVMVSFTAAFDLGMPTLAPIIHPIAEEVLVENVQAILRGLLGEQIEFGRGGGLALVATPP